MRFREFKVIKEATDTDVVVIGDSIAVGIAGAGGVSGKYTQGGWNTQWVLDRLVVPFVKSGGAKDKTVILSSGAANSGNVYTADGKQHQREFLSAVSQQIKLLKEAGATVALVGVASQKTPLQKPTDYTHGQQWYVDYTGMNQKLESIASSSGAKFLGKLEDYDPNISKVDGIHPYNGYGKLFKAGSQIAKDTTSKINKVEQPKESSNQILVPRGRVAPEVADIQKVLLALGYKLPKHGVDGVRGPETVRAIKQFQTDNGLQVDGDPGPETVAALNKLIDSKNIKFAKSTEADVKGKFLSASDAQDVGDILNDNNPLIEKARDSAERYLGRKMNDEEWTALLKVTAAEEADQEAMAWVMAAILNRVNRGTWGNDVVRVVSAPSQFEPVTGPRGDEKRLHTLPIPRGQKLKSILDGAVEILPSVPKKIVNFTSNIDAAYKGRSSISYKHKLLAQGGKVVGNSVFASA